MYIIDDILYFGEDKYIKYKHIKFEDFIGLEHLDRGDELNAILTFYFDSKKLSDISKIKFTIVYKGQSSKQFAFKLDTYENSKKSIFSIIDKGITVIKKTIPIIKKYIDNRLTKIIISGYENQNRNCVEIKYNTAKIYYVNDNFDDISIVNFTGCKDPPYVDTDGKYVIRARKNKLSINNCKLYYPYDLGYSFKVIRSRYELCFVSINISCYIVKDYEASDIIKIVHHIPPSLLLRFLHNINVFDDEQLFRINSEFDIMKRL